MLMLTTWGTSLRMKLTLKTESLPIFLYTLHYTAIAVILVTCTYYITHPVITGRVLRWVGVFSREMPPCTTNSLQKGGGRTFERLQTVWHFCVVLHINAVYLFTCIKISIQLPSLRSGCLQASQFCKHHLFICLRGHEGRIPGCPRDPLDSMVACMCLKGHQRRILGCPRDPPDSMGPLSEGT